MTLICFASQKGSPGTTATTLAVAAALKLAPGRRKLLLEADTTGGTLAIRYRLPTEPGLLTLAAAVRSGMESDEIWRHAQELPGGLPVIVCPDGPEQVNAAMAASGAQLGRFLAGLRDVDVLCDVGRLAPSSPALDFVAEASALLMVSRPTAEQLQPAARRMMMLRPHVQNLGWVLIGQKPYGPLDVEQTFKFPVVGVIADDARSVTSLENGVVTKRLRRHPFIRSSSTLAGTLSDWLAPLTAVQPAADGQEGPPQAAPVPEPATLDLASAPPPGQPSRNGAQSAGPDADGPAGRPPEGFRGTADAPPMPDGTGRPPVDVPSMPDGTGGTQVDVPSMPDGTGGTQVDVPPMPDGAGRPPADVPPMPPVEPPDADVAAMPPPELSEADVSMAPPPAPAPAPNRPMPPDHRPASPNGNAVANSAVTNNAATDNAVANSAVTDNAVTDSAVANNAVTGNPVVDTGGAPTAVSGSRPGSSQPPMPGGPAPMTPPRPAVAPPDGTVSQSWDPPATNVNGSEPAGQAGDGLPADELDDWDGSQFIVTGDLREVFRPPANLGPAEPANGTDGATSASPAQTSPAQTSPDRTSAAQTSPDRTSPAHPSPIRNDKPRVQPSPFPHEESDADRMSQ